MLSPSRPIQELQNLGIWRGAGRGENEGGADEGRQELSKVKPKDDNDSLSPDASLVILQELLMQAESSIEDI